MTPIRTFFVAILMMLPLSMALAQPSSNEPPPAPAGEETRTVTGNPPHATVAPEEAEEKPSLLAPDFGSAVWTIVLFVIILVVLRFSAWSPILKGLQSREEKMRSDLRAAEEGAKKAAATLAEYQAKLATAQAEVMKLMDQGRIDAQRLADSIKTQAQDEITATRKRAEADIRTAKEQALTEIYTTTATLATDVAGKILRRQINAGDQQQLVQESLAELGKTQN